MINHEIIDKKYRSLLGKQWDNIKHFADEDGWILAKDIMPQVLYIMKEVLEIDLENERWRPKSLKILENSSTTPSADN